MDDFCWFFISGALAHDTSGVLAHDCSQKKSCSFLKKNRKIFVT